MRIAFMGTPDFAVPSLDALHAAGHDIVAVYTQPPRPAGRGKALMQTPVHKRAVALGIEVRHPPSLKGADEQAAFAALAPDVAVVAAYGLILLQPILDAPRLGCLNVHASLLPRWRGAAPIQRAILAGDETTGVTIMQMERGLDTGPMLARLETPIDGKTTGTLTAELAEKGAALMAAVLGDPGAYPPVGQPEDGVTYAHKIDKTEARLDFSADAEQVERQVRAFNPPGAFFELDGERFRILEALLPRDGDGPISTADVDLLRGVPGTVIDDRFTIACGTGAIRPALVQRAGRPAMATAELLRGYPILAGTRVE